MPQFGRKIYYDLATGNLIQDTGEYQGGLSVGTTTEQDFASWIALSQRVPSTVGVIELQYGELSDSFLSSPAYHVDIATQQLVFADPIPPVSIDPLDLAKQRKLDELTVSCHAALETFSSSALGTPHTYLSRANSIPNDMLLLSSEYSYVKGSDYDLQPITWYTVESGNVSHTAAQFIQVYLDARTNVATRMYHRATLEAQVNAATTIDAVNAIVW